MRSRGVGDSLALFGRWPRVIVETRRWPAALKGVIEEPRKCSGSVICQRCFGFPARFLGSCLGCGGVVMNDGERASEGCWGKIEAAGPF